MPFPDGGGWAPAKLIAAAPARQSILLASGKIRAQSGTCLRRRKRNKQRPQGEASQRLRHHRHMPQAGGFIQTEHQIHALHPLPCSTFN